MNGLATFAKLQNILEREAILSNAQRLHLSQPLSSTSTLAQYHDKDDLTLASSQRAHILSVLELCQWKGRRKYGRGGKVRFK